MHFDDIQVLSVHRIDSSVTTATIKRILEATTKERGIPATVTTDTVRSGGWLFGKEYDAVVCRHPREAYKNVVFCVVEGILNIALFGYSKAGHITAKAEEHNKTHVLWQKRGDYAGLQIEMCWRESIIDCII